MIGSQRTPRPAAPARCYSLTVGRFWSAALGRPLDAGADSGFASIGFAARRDRNGWGPVDPADEPTWVFPRVPEPKAGKNRLHLDVVAADVEAEIAGLVALGATRVTDHRRRRRRRCPCPADFGGGSTCDSGTAP